jgi:cell division protein ZipA
LTTSGGEPDLEAVHRELSSLQDLLKHEAHDAGSALPRYNVEDESVPALLRNSAEKSPASPPEEKLVVLYLVAHPNQVFTASLVGESLRDLDLEYGDMHIYHRYPDEPDNTVPIFGVANLVEPGTLDPETLAETGTPGLTLFLQLPGPLRPVQAFDLFVTTAQQLTTHLDGELRDKNRNVLSRQLLEHLRDDVQQYERRLRLPHA